MKHYNFLNNNTSDDIFYVKPENVTKLSDKEMIAMALGATMYSQGTYEKYAEKIRDKAFEGLTSSVLCLEDSIPDNDVEFAERNIIKQLELITSYVENNELREEDVPFIMIRVRNPEQLMKILTLGNEKSFKYLVGFNFPKITSDNAEVYLRTLSLFNKRQDFKLYALPILETPEIMYLETRQDELIKLKKIFDHYHDMILTIRMGGTDFSSLFGIRRGIDFNIYNIGVVSNCLSDIKNVFGRVSSGYVLSGVVWEYFPDGNRLLKPQLRETPFIEKQGTKGRKTRWKMITDEIDGLIKEVILDKANGYIGKTIIHPSHIKVVNAINAVTHEEYLDALSILNADGGVMKGISNNKMNETKPHYNWANLIIKKSKVYGVLNKNAKYIDLF